jgi:hypothetical protein
VSSPFEAGSFERRRYFPIKFRTAEQDTESTIGINVDDYKVLTPTLDIIVLPQRTVHFR